MDANFNKKKALPTVFICVLLILAAGCKKDRLKVDISGIEVKTQFKRFDKDLQAVSSNFTFANYLALKEKYPVFFRIYNTRIISLNEQNDTATYQNLKQFVEYDATVKLNAIVQKKFADMDAYNQQIIDAFKHYKYYYPTETLPDIIYFSGIINTGSAVLPGHVAVGLDWYLGKDYPYAKMSHLFNYQTVTMYPEYITQNVVNALALDRFEKYDKGHRFLDKMIYEGKIAYFIDAMMPEAADSLRMRLSTKQLKWCKDNEWQIWDHLVDPKLKVLYTSDAKMISRYFEEGAFTNAPGVQNEPEQSSPRFAVWAGRQIIRKYMAEHPETTLPQLMEETDSDKILRESKYRP